LNIFNAFKYYIPALVAAFFLFYMSSLPGSSIPSMGVKYEDLLFHFAAYSVFGSALGLAFLHDIERQVGERIFLVVAVGVLYGFSDEFHQMFVPSREATIADVIADGLGATGGIYLFLSLTRLLAKRGYRFASSNSQ